MNLASLNESIFAVLQTELGQLCTDESIAMIYQPLHDVIQVQFMEGNDKRVLSGGWSWFGSNKKNYVNDSPDCDAGAYKLDLSEER